MDSICQSTSQFTIENVYKEKNFDTLSLEVSHNTVKNRAENCRNASINIYIKVEMYAFLFFSLNTLQIETLKKKQAIVDLKMYLQTELFDTKYIYFSKV